MKGKNLFLAWLLVFSGLLVAVLGVIIRFVILEPLGIQRQEPIVALPFVLLRDDGLRFVITDLRQAETGVNRTEPTFATQPPNTEVVRPQRDLLEKVLFIGDSRTCSLRDHARLDVADYFCKVGMSVFSVAGEKLSDDHFDRCTLAQLLAEREYSCIVIGLGLNEAGYPMDSMLHAYRKLLTVVIQTQPQAVVVLQSVMCVARSWVRQAPYTSADNLNRINREIANLAQDYRVHFVDTNERFADENGYLPEQMTADGCHLHAKYTVLFAQWLYGEMEKLDQ